MESLDEIAPEDNENLKDNLTHYLRHPININEANQEALNKLLILNKFQIRHLLDHRDQYGKIEEIEELQLIKGFDEESIEILKPFIHFGNANNISNKNQIDKNIHHLLSIRGRRIIEKSRGFTEKGFNGYQGDVFQVWMRYQFDYKKRLSAGFTMEKDPGEQIPFIQTTGWNEFHSAYIRLKDYSIIEQIIVGDYQTQFGQGLTFYTGNSFGKSSDVLLVEKNGPCFRANTSSNEYLYLRGVISSLKINKLRLTPFISKRNLDANMKEINGTNYISSFSQSGLHRNKTELSHVHNVQSGILGLNLQRMTRNYTLGGTFVYHQLNKNLEPDNTLQDVYSRSAPGLGNVGVYCSKSFHNSSVFGEFSKSLNHGNAFILGINTMPTNKLALAFVYRNYGIDYHPIYSAAFGENSTNTNEKGIYSALKIYLNSRLAWSFYMDHFSFPWLKHNVLTPSNGVEYLSEIKYVRRKKMELLIRYKYKQKMGNLNSDMVINGVEHSMRQSLRFQFNYMLSKRMRFRSRLEFSRYKFDKVYNGFLTFQEMKYQIPGSKWSCLIRYSVFDTMDFNSRIYAYEQDLNGIYNVPSFSGKGSAYFVLIQFKILRFSTLGLKYSRRIYEDRQFIGSGLDEIPGNIKSEIKMQYRLKF